MHRKFSQGTVGSDNYKITCITYLRKENKNSRKMPGGKIHPTFKFRKFHLDLNNKNRQLVNTVQSQLNIE